MTTANTMEIVAVFLTCVAVAMASREMVAKDFDVTKPLDLCKAEGEFLLHPTNRCKFIRCTYGPEPWTVVGGNFQLYPVEMDCPYGTSVNRALYGDESYGYDNHDGLPLRASSLCSYRVNTYDYRHHHGYDYDQCSVEQPHNHNYGHTGYAHHGAAHLGAAHYGAAHHGFAHHAVAPKVSSDGYVDSGYGYKVFVNHGYGYGYPTYPVEAP